MSTKKHSPQPNPHDPQKSEEKSVDLKCLLFGFKYNLRYKPAIMLKCIRKTQGGKGNEGRFIERDPKGIIAAGILTAQPNKNVTELFTHYILKDEVDALLSDAIPPEKKQPSPKLRRRNFVRCPGVYTADGLLNPPTKSKFETLVDDLKQTGYNSYWLKPVGRTRDHVPYLPHGFDIRKETCGRKTLYSESAYDVIMPRDTPPDKTAPSLEPGYQTNRNYCKPPYDPNTIFGIVYKPEKSGIYAKRCFAEDRFLLGTGFDSPRNASETNLKIETVAQLGRSITPNNNIKRVPVGYAFGKVKPRDSSVPQCLTTCELNPGRDHFLKCLTHLNTLRICLFKLFDDEFFRRFYMHFQYLDTAKTGWLPKDVVYNYCSLKNVRVNPSLIEPLLKLWKCFDGSQIQYGLFVDIICYRRPLPSTPKIPDIAEECLEFSTTYNDMVRPGQKVDKRLMAGLPSARYFDKDDLVIPPGCCKADLVCLPQESDARACLNPSVFTIFGVSHRDLYAKRSPEIVRKVFENIGEKFTDEKFNELWNKAKKYHSQGWVSFATFRKVLDK